MSQLELYKWYKCTFAGKNGLETRESLFLNESHAHEFFRTAYPKLRVCYVMPVPDGKFNPLY